jgi:hypothetical protein
VHVHDASIEFLLLLSPLSDKFQEFFDFIYFFVDSVLVLTLVIKNELLLHVVTVDENTLVLVSFGVEHRYPVL